MLSRLERSANVDPGTEAGAKEEVGDPLTLMASQIKPVFSVMPDSSQALNLFSELRAQVSLRPCSDTLAAAHILNIFAALSMTTI